MTDSKPDSKPDNKTLEELERRSRRRWTSFIVGFFALQAGLWSFALTYVTNDPSHAVVEDYDRLALNWDEQRAKIDASAALGWHLEVDVQAGQPSQPHAPGTIRVTLKDRDRRAVSADQVMATVFHQAKASQRQTVELTETEPGLYVGHAALERAGKWRVRIDASRGEHAYFASKTQTLSPPGARP